MTGITSNIDQVIEKFKAIKERTENVDPSEALIVGVNAARGEMTFRIFNNGEDRSGNSLGSYKGKKNSFDTAKLFKGKKKEFFVDDNDNQFTPYQVKRIKEGRQIRYKDLEFTGTLRRGIVVLKESMTKVNCAVPSSRNIKIINGQEEQLNTKIFSLSESERQTLRENTIEALKQIYVRVFNTK